MNEDNTPANGGQSSMRAVVESYGTVAQGAEGLPEEHQPYVAQIMKMDPFDDVPGSVSEKGGGRKMVMKMEALPPDLRDEVYNGLRGVPEAERAAVESRLVAKVLRDQRAEIRVKTGLGEDALPYHREQLNLARQYKDLAAKRKWFADQLERVSGHETVEDPATGRKVPKEIMAINGERRKGYTAQMQEIDRQMRVLFNGDGKPGVEAVKRLREAMAESAALLHSRAQARAEEEEARKRALEINRNARIDKRAEALARMHRDEVK